MEAEVLVNGSTPLSSAFRDLSCFVEQEDALIGALTVRETISFASRLTSSRYVELQPPPLTKLGHRDLHDVHDWLTRRILQFAIQEGAHRPH